MYKILICISAWKDTLLLILVPGVGIAYSHSNTSSPWRTGGKSPFLTMDGNFLVNCSPFWETF